MGLSIQMYSILYILSIIISYGMTRFLASTSECYKKAMSILEVIMIFIPYINITYVCLCFIQYTDDIVFKSRLTLAETLKQYTYKFFKL